MRLCRDHPYLALSAAPLQPPRWIKASVSGALP